MSCPWAKTENSEPVKFKDIISAEIVRNLQGKKEKNTHQKKVDKISTTEVNDNPCEKNENFEDFKSYAEEDEIADIQNGKDYDTFHPLDGEFDYIPQCVLKKNKKIENAKYTSINGGRKTCKLSDKVFNSPEVASYDEEFMRYKVYHKRKRPTTSLLCIDQYTSHLIRKMLKDQVIVKVDGIWSIGEDAVTLSVSRTRWGIKYMMKVFKMNLKLGNKAHATACRKAEKEVAIYKRLKAAGIPCPTIIALKEHTLTISYITKLADLEKPLWFYFYKDDRQNSYMNNCLRKCYNEVREMIKRFYEANLIHPDLSQHNILYSWTGSVYIIDVGQCVERSHKDALNYLYRGCIKIFNLFKARGAIDIDDPDASFLYITGFSFVNLNKTKVHTKIMKRLHQQVQTCWKQ